MQLHLRDWDFHVTNVTGINTGKGYRTPPTTVSEPPESVQQLLR